MACVCFGFGGRKNRWNCFVPERETLDCTRPRVNEARTRAHESKLEQTRETNQLSACIQAPDPAPGLVL
jgi:hypothetical protein